MKKYFTLFLSIAFTLCLYAQQKYVLVIHGGAGTITKDNISAENENLYKAKLSEALQAGYELISLGKPSEEAVKSAIMVLENSPLFNAGKGSVFTHEGKNEMDASIMIGKTKNAGAVAGVTNVKNPILAAAAVMENSPHVLLSGKGAEQFAQQQGLEIVNPNYFYTEKQFNNLQQIIKNSQANNVSENNDWKFGTVGAVALDKNGNITAGTSTGGMTNKRWNRIGDSPIIGAGTYATDLVGVSCTGWGEYYIRTAAAYDLYARMLYAHKNIKTAATEVLQNIEYLGGNGGIIALDKYGNIAMEFNTAGMFRAAITEDGKVEIALYR